MLYADSRGHVFTCSRAEGFAADFNSLQHHLANRYSTHATHHGDAHVFGSTQPLVGVEEGSWSCLDSFAPRLLTCTAERALTSNDAQRERRQDTDQPSHNIITR